MLDKVIKWLRQAGAKKESDTERDGFLSWSGETHAVGLGFYYGFIDFKDWDGLPEGYAEGKNVERGWYAKGSYVLGAVTRVVLYLALGGALMNAGLLPF